MTKITVAEYQLMLGEIRNLIYGKKTTTPEESKIYKELRFLDPTTVDWDTIYDRAEEIAMEDGEIKEGEEIVLEKIRKYKTTAEEKPVSCEIDMKDPEQPSMDHDYLDLDEIPRNEDQ